MRVETAPSPDDVLVGQIQAAVDTVRARREAANTLQVQRCGRVRRHRAHVFVTSPTSEVDYQCPGHGGPRALWELAVEVPLALEVGIGGLVHSLGVSAA